MLLERATLAAELLNWEAIRYDEHWSREVRLKVIRELQQLGVTPPRADGLAEEWSAFLSRASILARADRLELVDLMGRIGDLLRQ